MISIWSAFDWSNGMTHGYNDAVRRLRHKKFHEGILLLTKEACDGNAAAQYRLGLMYEFGAGAVRNVHHAQGWYRKSARLGYAPAKMRLDLIAADYSRVMPNHEISLLVPSGNCLSLWTGVQESLLLADSWCQKASTDRDKQIETDILCSRLD